MQGGLSALPAGTRLRGYLDSAAAHGISPLDAIHDAIEGKPGYRHSPHSPDTRSRDP
jgi:hypothetical protein